ncbi:MAG: alpha/beta hydrolase [Clostridia bacterium]|nr:alpha/beta hydrolase [Clostridia bacterium]
MWWLLGVALFLFFAVLLTAYICFYMVFYASPKSRIAKEEYPIPEGEIYEPYRAQMTEWMKAARAYPYREIEITSHDGLRLRGRYYEQEAGAPIELLMHGYRGSADRDLSGGVARCFSLGHNALIVDHRASGRSEGKVITFGILEHRDCLAWVDCILREIDPHARIILTGISMGAATVMIAAGEALPPNVVGVLADCGYTTAKEIICKVIAEMHLPPRLLYPFVRLGGRLFGGFDVDEKAPIEAMRRCRLPVIFFHGDTDDFVPCEMSHRNYEACTGEKRLVITPNAGHGLCYPADRETYANALREFFDHRLQEQEKSV